MSASKKPWIDDATFLPRMCAAYLESFNVKDAAAAVGVSDRSVYRYLDEPVVQEHLKSMVQPVIDEANVTVERILKELSNAAFLDIAELVDERGVVHGNVHDIPEQARRTITEIDQKTEKYDFLGEELPIGYNLNGEMVVLVSDLVDGDPQIRFDKHGQMVVKVSQRIVRTRVKCMSKERTLELLGKYREIAMFKDVVETEGRDEVARVRTVSLEERVAGLEKDRVASMQQS